MQTARLIEIIYVTVGLGFPPVCAFSPPASDK
jgi:hypothetical protein